MKYYIRRELNEYGPYSLADLQQFVAQRNVLLTDLARCEGITEWAPVSQVIGNIPVPMQSGSTVYGSVTASPNHVEPIPPPPNFHWLGVLGLTWLTQGLFTLAWSVVQANWVRKATNNTKDIYLLAGALGSFITGLALILGSEGTDIESPLMVLGVLLFLGGYILNVIATFSMRNSIQKYYNTIGMNLSLSGVMTFFFNATFSISF